MATVESMAGSGARSTLARMSCTALNIAGGILEVSGFIVVAWELARVQRREFGAPKVWRSLRAWVRRLLGWSRAIEVSLEPVRETDTLLGPSVRHRPGDSIEERVSALEQSLRHLEDEVSGHRKSLEAQIRKVREELNGLRTQVEQERQQAEEERKEALKSSLAFQWIGTGLFVIGAVLTIIGNSC